MSFESVNEIDKFSFDDCIVKEFEVQEGQLHMVLEALIVRPRNSQNTNYTESYAGPTTVRLTDGKLLSGMKEGYKVYDANEVLLEEVPNEVFSAEELAAFPKKCKDVYLFSMEKEDEKDGVSTYYMEFEFPGEDQYDTARDDTFELKVSFTSAIFSWERYMNRVEQ